MKKYYKTLIKYSSYLGLRSDLILLRNTEYFDVNYYRTYYLNFSRKRIYPYLHYLLYGGFVGCDPSPNFDSSFYLSSNPDIKESGLNPLVHFLRIGAKENRKPLSPEGGKRIEFIGLPGSGKTTLYKELNSCLAKRLGYPPGPKEHGKGILFDRRILAQSGGIFSCLTNFINENSGFIKNILIADEVYQYSEATPTLRNIVMTYFFVICTYYQAVKQDYAKPWFLLDEAFYYQVYHFIINEVGGETSKVSHKILETMPEIDILIYMKTDVNLCLKRMKERKAGIPSPYRLLSEKEFLNFLTEEDKKIDNFIDYLENQSIKIIRIQANLSLEQALNKILQELSPIL